MRYLPHINIKASLKLRKNVDGVVDIIVKVWAGVESVRPSLEQKVGQELQQLLRGNGLVEVIFRIVYSGLVGRRDYPSLPPLHCIHSYLTALRQSDPSSETEDVDDADERTGTVL